MQNGHGTEDYCVVWDYGEAAYLLTSLDQVKDPAEILHKGTNNECIAWILEQLGDE